MSRFEALRQLGLHRVALFEWRSDLPNHGFFMGVWDGLAAEWRSQLAAFAKVGGTKKAEDRVLGSAAVRVAGL